VDAKPTGSPVMRPDAGSYVAPKKSTPRPVEQGRPVLGRKREPVESGSPIRGAVLVGSTVDLKQHPVDAGRGVMGAVHEVPE